jgi:hypothetical protein
VQFLAVYIKEAHPEDGWVMHDNRRSGISVQDPRNTEERLAVAQSCGVQLRIEMPMVVDTVDNTVASTYGGWPDRLYLIDRAGRIAYQSGEGPFGFKPEELEGAIGRS